MLDEFVDHHPAHTPNQ